MDIKQVAKQLDMSTDTIRKWERLGMIPPVTRNHEGLRDFTENDIYWVKYAKLLNKMHVSSDFQIEYVKLAQLGQKAMPARRLLLKEQIDQLDEKYQTLTKYLHEMEKLVEKEEFV